MSQNQSLASFSLRWLPGFVTSVKMNGLLSPLTRDDHTSMNVVSAEQRQTQMRKVKGLKAEPGDGHTLVWR